MAKAGMAKPAMSSCVKTCCFEFLQSQIPLRGAGGESGRAGGGGVWAMGIGVDDVDRNLLRW